MDRIDSAMDNSQNDIDLLNSLNSELNRINLQIESTYRQIKELNQQITVKKAQLYYLDLSEQESRRIAEEMENKAEAAAAEILKEAEIITVGRKAEQIKAQIEIDLLQKELDSLINGESVNHVSQQGESMSITPPDNHEELSSAKFSDETYSENNSITIPCNEDGTQPAFPADQYLKSSRASSDDSIYNMKLVSFINARHFVTFGGKAGPVHAHSWQVEVEVEVPRVIGDTIEFTKVFKAVTGALAVYENTILNQVHPFNLIQPTTENIAMYAYNRVDEVLTAMRLELVQLNLWETPTRGINVTNHNLLLDEQIRLAAQTPEAADMEAAASFDLDIGMEEKEIVDTEEKVRSYPQVSMGQLRPAYSLRQYILAVAVICIVGVLAYHNVLWPPIEQRYPWGSDSWGHLFKAEMLYQQILNGNFYPQFTEYWYNGIQPFRYWAPLPYYLLALLRVICGDIFTAGNLYIFICVLFGSLSCLLLARRMGIWPAVMTALVWMLWQDNVRVAFSEGNLPRVLATALLPLLLVVFMQVLDNKKPYRAILGTIILIQLVVLCHAMIAAVYCICLAMFAFFLWVFQGISINKVVEGILVIAAGLASSCWWLLPSLTGGGITTVDPQAVKEIVQFVAAGTSLNPLYRFTNIETFYWGITLIAGLIISIVSWKSKPAWAKSLLVCGIILVIITFPVVRAVYISLPLSHLLWPLRFSSFAALAGIAACFCFNTGEERQGWLKTPYVSGMLILTLFVCLIVDNGISFKLLVHTGNMPFNIIQSGDYIKQKPGWRVATIDLSQLGSAPSYAFSEMAGLEQVFGWAWQGAVTSRNIMLLNTGLEQQFYPFLFRSCVDLGATDLVLKEDVISNMDDFRKAAAKAGYTRRNKFAGISVWRSIDGPYLVENHPECLVIGRYAGTIGVQFPEVEMGLSPLIDDYSLSELKKYKTVILSGSRWKSKRTAEKLISDYAASGGRVFVEMAGMPENVLAKQPEFLGVYGEPVSVRGEIDIWGKNQHFTLTPMWQKSGEWKAYVPMDLDKVEMQFTYYGNQAPILGYKLVRGHKIWFMGYNLSYYTFCKGSSQYTKLLSDILGLSTQYSPGRLIPLQNYQASEKGYSMSYYLDRNRTVILPVSMIDGTTAEIDGHRVKTDNFENLLQIKLPAGQHQLKVFIKKTPVFAWGKYLSLATILLILAALVYFKRAGEKR